MSTQQQNIQQQPQVQNQQQQQQTQQHQHEQQHHAGTEQQRWRNEAQYNKGKKEGLTREQIEAGTADVGYATTHAGYPEEQRGGQSGGRVQGTQPVRVGEDQYQQTHHLTKDNMIGTELKGPSEKIRESHGLKPEGDQACPSCNQKSCECEDKQQQNLQQGQQKQQQGQQKKNQTAAAAARTATARIRIASVDRTASAASEQVMRGRGRRLKGADMRREVNDRK